ncbi:MAG: hypothetical protein KDG55_06445 [Rhodocyclaceae bacterium]|nr:hypothetical protein [Rhodocyclaceae bacterium]
MESYVLFLFVLGLGIVLRAGEEKKRIERLGTALKPYRIEGLMETLVDGYLRALGEADFERREQVWHALEATEAALVRDLGRLSDDLQRAPRADFCLSTLPVPIPYAVQLFPPATLDLRRLVAIHAAGIARVAENAAGLERRTRAYRMTAEIYLLQHSCHWYCKSRAVATARLVRRHKTGYEQVLAGVSDETRAAYLGLFGRRP